MPKLKANVPGYETIPTFGGPWRVFGPPTPRRPARFEVARQPRLRLVRFLEPGVGGYAWCAESCRVRSLHPVRSRNTDLHGALKCELRTCVLAENDTPASS